MKYKVFVDGSEGTTGLQINRRLEKHENIEILNIDTGLRKDINARKELINSADIAFLCLPDIAAKEAVSLVSNDNTRIIDASTAHRTNPDWAYGLPEMSKAQREKIKGSKRVSVPGCHATGFTSLVYPLIMGGILPLDYPLTCQSITGYSGGGKSLIAKYEKEKTALKIPYIYSLGLTHKHLPEMKIINQLEFAPFFTPVLGDFYQGMLVSIPLYSRLLNNKITASEIQKYLSDYYKNETFINVLPFGDEGSLDNGTLDARKNNNTNMLDICIFGNDEQILATARFDNLGKGASGAAVQCMNIMLGIDESTALQLI